MPSARKKGGEKHGDMVRLEVLRRFGYYFTESSEHAAEYMPYWIKSAYPELIEEFNIPLDEYPRRCINQIKHWKERSAELVRNPKLEHKRTGEYASYIMEAMETDVPYRIGGNVMNTGLITNLPRKACVEVPCMVDGNGLNPCRFGALPPQLAALNQTHMAVHELVVSSLLEGDREAAVHALMLDPLTAAVCSLEEIRNLFDELYEAEREFIRAF